MKILKRKKTEESDGTKVHQGKIYSLYIYPKILECLVKQLWQFLLRNGVNKSFCVISLRNPSLPSTAPGTRPAAFLTRPAAIDQFC
jgi:hypothetical protein